MSAAASSWRASSTVTTGFLPARGRADAPVRADHAPQSRVISVLARDTAGSVSSFRRSSTSWMVLTLLALAVTAAVQSVTAVFNAGSVMPADADCSCVTNSAAAFWIVASTAFGSLPPVWAAAAAVLSNLVIAVLTIALAMSHCSLGAVPVAAAALVAAADGAAALVAAAVVVSLLLSQAVLASSSPPTIAAAIRRFFTGVLLDVFRVRRQGAYGHHATG